MTSTELETTLRLLNSAKTGNEAALNDLFSRYLPRVRRIVALRLGKSLDDMSAYEDFVQEALVRALSGIDRFEPRSVGEFRSWLAKCAVSAIQDEYRARHAKKRGRGREKRVSDLGDEPLASWIFAGNDPTASKIASDRELADRIHAALLQLNERYREIIVLRHYCELSAAEIAERMGFESAGAVRLACHRAIAKLRETVQGSS